MPWLWTMLVLVGCAGPTGAPLTPTATLTNVPTAATTNAAAAPATATGQGSAAQTSTGPPNMGQANGRLPTGEFFLGLADAPVTLEEWGDFQ